jgi:hypothetical protein
MKTVVPVDGVLLELPLTADAPGVGLRRSPSVASQGIPLRIHGTAETSPPSICKETPVM